MFRILIGGLVSQSASQANAFFLDVEREREVWTVRDDGGYPAPMNPEGIRAQPFWSSESRVLRIIKNVPAYVGMRAESISLDVWRNEWLPRFEADGIQVGINWSGPRAVGYDFTVPEVLARLDAYAQGWRPRTGWPKRSDGPAS
jgi:hypothetical protein